MLMPNIKVSNASTKVQWMGREAGRSQDGLEWSKNIPWGSSVWYKVQLKRAEKNA